jgi:hypothetical protein
MLSWDLPFFVFGPEESLLCPEPLRMLLSQPELYVEYPFLVP